MTSEGDGHDDIEFNQFYDVDGVDIGFGVTIDEDGAQPSLLFRFQVSTDDDDEVEIPVLIRGVDECDGFLTYLEGLRLAFRGWVAERNGDKDTEAELALEREVLDAYRKGEP